MTNKKFASIEFKCTLGLSLSSNNGHNYTPYAGRMTVLRFMCTVILALVATFEAIASPHIVSIDAAKKIAADFIGDNVEIVKKDYASRARALSMQDTTSQPLYIFNSSAGKGFIIVSGDDRTAKILGYSDSGIFDADNIPPGLNWLLEQYQAQIKSLDGAVPVQSVSESTNWATIEPLLTAYWHQGAPFNGLLPMNTLYNDHTSVGCVPTAIAQIVHFHKWPDRGEGIFLYTDWMGRTFDFDYENTSFNYNLINGEYNEQSPKESCDEVAKLVYACAVGMETSFDYDSGMGSGSDIAMAKRFLLENFKYSADAEILGMGNFSTDEWNEIIYKELQASRPVYMQGGSHAFVCDGYGGDKYFHFNWGWGCKENGNGYFLLSVLNPGENNYTSDLAAMINIHKREGGKEPYTYDIICNDEVVLDTVNGALMMDCGMWTNYSRYDIVEGSLYFEYVNTETLDSYYEKIDNGINIAGTVPFWGPWIERNGSGVGASLNNTNSQLAPGKYKIYPAYSVAESPIKRVRCLAGARQYINLTVNDNYECIYANSEDVVVPNARIAVDCVYSSGKTSGVNTKDGTINIEYTVKNYSDNYPFGNWTCSIINEEGVEVTKWRECPCYNKPNSESSQSLSSGIYLHPEKHQIIFFDTYGNDITEKPYYFQVEGEPHTLEITQVKYDWEYQQGELCYTFDVGIKTSHPGNIVPDLSIKLLMDGNEVFSQIVDGVDYGPLGIENGVRIFYSSAKSLGGEYQIDIYDVYGNQLKNSPFNIAIPPISVALSDTAISLKEDESYTLTAKVKPSIIPVQWNSSNSAVATVDDNGKVTAIAEGSATITAKAGDKSAVCVVTVAKKVVAVSGITLSHAEASLVEGETLTLTATVSPADATDMTVTWSSSNGAVATVDDNGKLTAVAEGTATITAKAGDKEATCVVTVEKKIISVTGVTLSQTEATLTEGESLTLTATIAPDNATDKTVAWSSSNAAVATVDNNGVVTAVAEGTATITAKAGDKEATCVVTVEKKIISVTGITLNRTEATLTEGESLTLTATVAPDNATDKTVAWSSSNAAVATVDNNGVVTAVAEGTATITAKAGDKEATCVVTVEKKIISVTGITLNQNEATLIEGESLTLTATVAPDNATDKTVAWSSSNAAVATVEDGVVTAVAAGTATIIAKAGDKSAACVVTVEKKAEEIVYAEIAGGDYYLKNVGSGKFLTGANDWGTQASLGEYGLSITLERLPNGKYTLDTHVANNETDHYLGSNGYIDASVAEWIITEPKSGTYALTLDGTSYWGYDGSGTVLANALTDPTQKNAQWQLVTRAELENALSKAALNNGVDATFYIQGHSFNRNHNENAAWMGEPVLGGPAHDMNAEKWNTTPLDIYQELSGMPNGYYVVEVQGFYRDNVDPNVTAERRAAGTEQLRANFYAGVYSVPLKSILDGATAEQLNASIQTSYGWVPNSMDETASYFAQGFYINKVDAWVTDGTLRIGIRKETGEEGDWVIFDNFRLTYYGTKAPAGIGQLTTDKSQMTIYDLMGRKVTDTENLKGGIYIVNGQKIIIKE